MQKGLAEALRNEITKRDSAYETLSMIDEILHTVIDTLQPMHTADEDCTPCAEKRKAREVSQG